MHSQHHQPIVGLEGIHSDHRYIEWKTTPPTSLPAATNNSPGFCFRKADWGKFQDTMADHLGRIRPSIVAATNTAAIEINTAITQGCAAAMPPKKIYTKSVPWWTPELTTLRKAARRARNIFQRSTEDEREENNTVYRQAPHIYKTKMTETRLEKWREFCSQTNGKNPWTAAYQAISRGQGNRHLQTIEGVHDRGETIEALMRKCFPRDDPTADTEQHAQIRRQAHLLGNAEDDRPFTASELLRAVKWANPKKAPGIDGITADTVKMAITSNVDTFLEFFNKCLELHAFPDFYKQQLVKFIPKPGKSDWSDISSYRPISLLPVVGKVLDGLLISRVEYHLHTSGQMNQNQYGFCKGRSTIDAIEEVISFIQDAKARGRYSALITLDISGAFDNAWWPHIIQQLKNKSCPANLISITQDNFRNRTATAKTIGQQSVNRVERGCPQGSRSGPGLWKVHYYSVEL